MHSNCEFCHQGVSKVCCYQRCIFSPFICGRNCVSDASFKVHYHQPQSQNNITLLNRQPSYHISIQTLHQTIKCKIEKDKGKLMKSKTRIIQKLESITKQFEDLYLKIFTIDPNIKKILHKLQSSDLSLTGANIYTILNDQFYNMTNPKNNFVSEFEESLIRVYNQIQSILDGYQTYQLKQQKSDILLQQSTALIQQQQFTSALVLLHRATQLNPLNSNILFQISYCRQKLGQYDKSISNYQQIIQFYPQVSSYCHNNIGSIYFQQKQFQKSIEYYSKAILIDNEISKYYFNRGNAYSYLTMNKQAIQDYTRAIEINPNNPSYYCNRGVAYKQIEKYHCSYLDFMKACELEDNLNYSYNRDLVLNILKQESQKSMEITQLQ